MESIFGWNPLKKKFRFIAKDTIKEFKEVKGNKSNIEFAKKVGAMIAEKALNIGIQKVVFDRAGYRYHGCIKALADAAREKGLQF